jgi:hypothetical protein
MHVGFIFSIKFAWFVITKKGEFVDPQGFDDDRQT